MDVNIGLLAENKNQDKSFSASRDSFENNGVSEVPPEPPKSSPMAFTIDFGGGKSFDKSRLEHLAKQSQVRHQRVQSMSASLSRTSPTTLTPQKPPLSAKLPRKAQGYNSEGYFSSDQEDNFNSGSVKIKQSPLTQNNDFRPHSFSASPILDKLKRPMKSPTPKSKSPIVDSIMSRSDILPSRQGLNLPLKNTFTGSYHDLNSVHSFNYSNRQLNSILDQSPDGILLTDISSPELDAMTPDNIILSPIHKSPKREVPDLFKRCIPKNELEILEDADNHSDDSSTGTYTIEADYSEEQKARMSIDRTFGVDLLQGSLSDPLQRRSASKERDPELIIDSREPSVPNTKLSNDKNVLQLNCYHDADLAEQTSKQIKSTRNYLEKIKNRVRTISEKTFHNKPSDEGSFTSVTASGVFAKTEPLKPRRLSLSKSSIDQTDYIHRLSCESSVPISLATPPFESTVLKTVTAKVLDDSGISNTPDSVVGRLSHLSLNRGKGDQNWIRDWAESADKYSDVDDTDNSFANSTSDKSPVNRRQQIQKNTNISLRCLVSSSATKIPSPVSSSRNSPRQDASHETTSYLLKTQNAISNLQAKLNTKPDPASIVPAALTTSLMSEKTPSTKLPVPQLSRSNSLNYRLKRKELGSPLRSPGHYVITGSNASPSKLSTGASRSFERTTDSDTNSPTSDRTLSSDDKTLSHGTHAKHTRHKSDGRDYVGGDNCKVDLKTVLRNNALEARGRIEPAARLHDNAGSIRRSSSFGAVNRSDIRADPSDESERLRAPEVRYNRTMALRKGRLRSPEPDGVGRCPNTPEPRRKMGPGAVRATARQVRKEGAHPKPARGEEAAGRGGVCESARAEAFSRLTKSRSSTREMQPRKQDKSSEKSRQRCCSSLARELNYANFKRRTTYDPMKAARQDHTNHSSPVHRSQSFHSTNLVDLDRLCYSSEEEQGVTSAAIDPMVTSTHSEILRPTLKQTFHMNQAENGHRRDLDKRKTFIMDGAGGTIDKRPIDGLNIDSRTVDKRPIDSRTIDKRDVDRRKFYIEDDDRKTFILDSDTNSTTNGSSPRNSSIFSHEKVSLTTGPSDTDGESGTESAPVATRPGRRAGAPPANRHSGDYSASSSAASLGRVQPRYLDIARFRRERHEPAAAARAKGSAGSIESEQKKAALEKWKRRASYDPRKSAATDRASRQPAKTASSVLRSQSFNGPVSSMSRYIPTRHIPEYGDDYTSDNDF